MSMQKSKRSIKSKSLAIKKESCLQSNQESLKDVFRDFNKLKSQFNEILREETMDEGLEIESNNEMGKCLDKSMLAHAEDKGYSGYCKFHYLKNKINSKTKSKNKINSKTKSKNKINSK
jgi:hypothetical protein